MKAQSVKNLVNAALIGILISCGSDDNNRVVTPGTNPTNPAVLPGGVQENLTFGQKFQIVETHPQMQCQGNVPRIRIGFKMQSPGYGAPDRVVQTQVNLDLNNIANTKGVYMGSTPENDIVAIKDYGNSKDVIISMCDITRWGAVPLQVNFELMSPFYGSPVTSCSVQQVSLFDIVVTNNQTFEQIYLQVGPINGFNAIEGVCPTDLLSDQI